MRFGLWIAGSMTFLGALCHAEPRLWGQIVDQFAAGIGQALRGARRGGRYRKDGAGHNEGSNG